jgi:RiboL-PSP-HEPN
MQQSKAILTFSESIKDAENLLSHFITLNYERPPPETEVLKRAGLVMAMTAWETYVEDSLTEVALETLKRVEDIHIAGYVQGRLFDEIKRLHNPTSAKTIQLFKDFAGVDLSSAWTWNQMDAPSARKRLDDYMKLRGDVVHRSRKSQPRPTAPHPVNKDDLLKAIRFLKELVNATDKALQILVPAREHLRDVVPA